MSAGKDVAFLAFILIIVVTPVGGLLWFPVSSIVDSEHFSRHARPLSGDVISVRETRTCQASVCTDSYVPRVRYRLPVTGETIESDVDEEYRNPPELGPRTVYYDPSDPRHVRLDTGLSSSARAAVTGLVLWAVLGVAAGFVALTRPIRRA